MVGDTSGKSMALFCRFSIVTRRAPARRPLRVAWYSILRPNFLLPQSVPRGDWPGVKSPLLSRHIKSSSSASSYGWRFTESRIPRQDCGSLSMSSRRRPIGSPGFVPTSPIEGNTEVRRVASSRSFAALFSIPSIAILGIGNIPMTFD